MNEDAFKLILLGPFLLIDERPQDYTDPEMICHFEPMLSMWQWHHAVRKWIRDQTDAKPFFRTQIRDGEWTLESHGWHEPDTILFHITFAAAIRHLRVEPMTKLEQALAAHSAVIGAKPEDRDAAYYKLLEVFGTFDMTVDGTAPAQAEAASFLLLHNRSPTTQMVTIVADLAKRGIMPPALADSPTLTERLIYGIVAQVDMI